MTNPQYLFQLVTCGGNGGGPFDHSNELQEQGCTMGCGSKGVRLSSISVEQWTVLSHMSATYTPWNGQGQVVTTGTGNIRRPPAEVVNIEPNERVCRVSAEFGFYTAAAGAECLNHLRLQIRMGAAAEPQAGMQQDSVRICRIGSSMLPDNRHTTAGQGQHIKVVDIPEGLTLAGLSGRAGDSWDQVTLHVCPFLPGGGQWNRGLHAHYPQPFKEQVRTLLLCLLRWNPSNNCCQSGTTAAASEGATTATVTKNISSSSSSSSHSSTARDRRISFGLQDKIVAVLFKVTFLADEGLQAAVCETSAGEAAAAPAAAAGDGGSSTTGVAEATGGDYISRWMQQQVDQAVQQSNRLLPQELDSDEFEDEEEDDTEGWSGQDQSEEHQGGIEIDTSDPFGESSGEGAWVSGGSEEEAG